MKLKTILRTSGAAAIAVALSLGALPAAAKDRGHGRESRGGDEQSNQTQPQYSRPAPVQRSQQAQQQQPQQRSYRAPQTQGTYQAPQTQRSWQRPAQVPTAQQQRGQGQWRGSGSSPTRQWSRDSDNPRQAQVPSRSQAWSGTRSPVVGGQRTYESGRSQGGYERNRSYTDRSRDASYRGGTTYQQRSQGSYRGGYRDGDRDHRSWSRDWRSNRQYNWYNYRQTNRNVYHLGRYYSPYSNYSYSRLNIGFRLGSLFFGSRYWINDPWQYRLPEAYGPYRWIRYYDDALLIDTYSGEVVDVIYDFFW